MDARPQGKPAEPEILDFIARTDAACPPDAVDLDIAGQRRVYDAMCAVFRRARPANVTVRDDAIAGAACAIAVRRYARSPGDPAARVIWLHGGGFVVGGLDSHDDVCAEICAETGFDVVSVDYRLCPEHPHPAAFEDARDAFIAIAAEGAPVVLAGDSAGGNLAAAVCLWARDHGGPQPAGQVMFYPGLGGDITRGSYVEWADAPMLTTRDIAFYSVVRSGGRARSAIADPTLSPLSATDFSGLAPSFAIAAECDPLRDDVRDWTAALQAAGVAAGGVVQADMVHGCLRARHMSPGARVMFAAGVAAITRFGHGSAQ